ncbi:MAG TPA: glycosyl hydrolase, partial [Verrucomicrobiota bacterium]|nr:glycosyl hydrolase [Verrucomicrobiota bacterium]
IEEWSKFAAAVVRYINVEHKAGIRYWEIWNEPDASHWFGRGWGGDPEHYSALFNSAVKSMKQVDPSIKVGTGGIADPYGGSLKSWWEPCLRDYGINRSIDFVCLHGYYGDPTNGHWLTALRNARALMRQYLGHEIPIWVTEFNADFRADFARRGLSYEKQSLYVAETLALFAHQKIDAAQYFCIGWYGSDFCPWESTDGGKRRPVVEAYHFWQDYRGQRMPVTVVGVKGDIFAVACRDGQKQVLYLPANQSSAYRAIFPGSGKPKRVVAQAFTGAVAEPLSVISTPAAGGQWEVKFSLPEAKRALVKVEVEW